MLAFITKHVFFSNARKICRCRFIVFLVSFTVVQQIEQIFSEGIIVKLALAFLIWGIWEIIPKIHNIRYLSCAKFYFFRQIWRVLQHTETWVRLWEHWTEGDWRDCWWDYHVLCNYYIVTCMKAVFPHSMSYSEKYYISWVFIAAANYKYSCKQRCGFLRKMAKYYKNVHCRRSRVGQQERKTTSCWAN